MKEGNQNHRDNATKIPIINEQETGTFTRNKSLPSILQFSQPKEPHLSQNITKAVNKEFNELNDRLIDNVTSGGMKKKRFKKQTLSLRESLMCIRRGKQPCDGSNFKSKQKVGCLTCWPPD